MSITVSIGEVLDVGTVPGLAGAASLELVSLGGEEFLYVAGEAAGDLVALSLSGGMSLVESVATGSVGLSGVVAVEGPLAPGVVTLGRYDTAPVFRALGAGGVTGTPVALADGMSAVDRPYRAVSYLAGDSYLALAGFGLPGLTLLRLGAGGTATVVETRTDTAALPLGDVTALEAAVLKGSRFLFAASGFDAGIMAARTRGDGTLAVLDTHLPEEGSGFAGVTALATAEIGSRAFVLFTATGTDSLHVLRLSAGGAMKEVDVFYDTRETRLANAQALEVFEASGRTFAAVAGGDDGVTVFELTWNGQLVHQATVADDFPTTLDNGSGLAAQVDGSTVRLFVSSPTDGGVTELVLDTGRSGEVLMGGAVADTLTGGAGDDELWGRGRGDVLSGGAGDDRLVDGRGRDVLTGGPGADVFVFVEDGRTDVITDFEIGVDRIDLSDFDRLYHISELEIGSRAGGAVVFVGEDIIRIADATGGPIDASLFGQDDFIFG